MNIKNYLLSKVSHKNLKIVFPEGHDIRIIEAAFNLLKDGVIPILIGNKQEISKKFNLNLDSLTYIDHLHFEKKQEMLSKFIEIRKGKESPQQCEELLQKSNYFAVMFVEMGWADGVVGGANYSTADSIKPAFQIFKAYNNFASSYCLMLRNEEVYLFSDCAVTIEPTSEQLATIAMATANSARKWGLDPRVALLSFSTKNSANHPRQKLVADAAAILESQKENLNFIFDGEIQFDAAFVEEVAKLKAPNSPIKGKANVFIFPNLDAGNIGYKIAQRLGKFLAVGPILQGLKKPLNDLSRGTNAEEVYMVGLITALEALELKNA